MVVRRVTSAKDGAFYRCPLQLISMDDEGKLQLNSHAVDMLCHIDGRLAVVGIAGLYRTGKSFLLNRLLGFQEGFDIGPSVNPCTKGIWVWGQPVQLDSDYHCIFLDTEGLGSAGRTATCDMQIFSLCVLLSSCFIYNSMGAIDEMAIDDLHLVLQLAKQLLEKNRVDGGAGNGNAGQALFPSLFWVLRDFHLKLVDSNGTAISEQQYLEESLRPVPGQKQRNEVRKVIKDLFPERTCATLVRPTAEEEDLQRVQNIPFSDLRPVFQTQVDNFTKRVYAALQPKVIEGTLVSGTMLVNLASEYCAAMNKNVMPVIKSTWASVVQISLRECLRDASNSYRKAMEEEVMDNLPLSEEDLLDRHEGAKARAFRILAAPNFPENDTNVQQQQAVLARQIRQLYECARSENALSSHHMCSNLAEELYENMIAEKLNVRGSYQCVEDLMQDWDSLQRVYMEKARGPAKAEVLSTKLFPVMTQSVRRLAGDQRPAREKERSHYCDLPSLLAAIRWPFQEFEEVPQR